MPRKLKVGPFGTFQHDFCRQASKKLKADHLRKKFFGKKSHNAEKKQKGDPLVSPSTVYYAEKQEKPIWFSSLGEMVQFDTIIFRRTFEELF